MLYEDRALWEGFESDERSKYLIVQGRQLDLAFSVVQYVARLRQNIDEYMVAKAHGVRTEDPFNVLNCAVREAEDAERRIKAMSWEEFAKR